MPITDALTQRELEVLQCAFSHDGDLKQTADRLFISHNTVRNHFHKSIFKKLMVNTLPGAFRVGLALNLISLEISLIEKPPDLYVIRAFP